MGISFPVTLDIILHIIALVLLLICDSMFFSIFPSDEKHEYSTFKLSLRLLIGLKTELCSISEINTWQGKVISVFIAIFSA